MIHISRLRVVAGVEIAETVFNSMDRGHPQGKVAEEEGVAELVGDTPLVKLKRLPGNHTSSRVYAKLEGDNPGSSIKDRAAISMINGAEKRGEIKIGDTIIEATSGNTGIALAMAASSKGYHIVLIMPENQSEERKQTMAAFGAQLVLVDAGSMEKARDLALQMESEGKGKVLNQFGNPDNPRAHYYGTAPEVASQTHNEVTHFVCTMGTTGTVTGSGSWFREHMPSVNVIGVLPDETQGGSIPGIRNWPPEYQPTITRHDVIDQKLKVTQRESEETARAMARVEGIFAGTSSGGSISAALRLAAEIDNATIVAIVCDRGDRYLSTGLFSTTHSHVPSEASPRDFWSAAARLTGLPTPLIYFRGSWCPDCQRCDGPIKRAADSAGASLLVCDVGERIEWKAKEHPFRQHKLLQLECLPTLAHWDNGALGSCLSSPLEKSKNEDEAEELITKWLRSISA